MDNKKTKKMFDTECGNLVAASALKINIFEKKLLKDGGARKVLELYNQIFTLCQNFDNQIDVLEVELKKENYE